MRACRGSAEGRWAHALAVAVVAVVAVALMPACGSDGDGDTDVTASSQAPTVDLVAELEDDELLSGFTDYLLGDGSDDPAVATPDGRADAVAAEIAEAVQLAVELLPADPEGYRRRIGERPDPSFITIGNVLGHLRRTLDEIEGDGVDRAETTAFALRLGWELAGRLGAPGGAGAPGGGVGVGWIVPDPAALPASALADVTALLGADRPADDRAAAGRLLEVVEPYGGAVVVDAIAAELSEVVPAVVGFDLVTTFRQAFDAAAVPATG